MAYDEYGDWVEEEALDAPKYPGFKALRSSDGSIYYVPSGEVLPPGQSGTALSQEEIPIPYVSLPDVPKEDVPPQKVFDGPAIPSEAPKTDYEVTPPETVPETPAEQLEKLLPPTTDPYEVAASRVRRRAPARPPEEQPPEPPSGRNPIEFATAPERLGAAKFLEHPGNLFYGIPAALAGLLADLEEKMPKPDITPPPDVAETPEEKIAERVRRRAPARPPDEAYQTDMRDVANYLKELSEGSKKFVGKITGTEGQKPTTGIEKLGSYIGEYSQPTKGVSAAATLGLAATGAAVRGGLTGIDPSDVPIPSLVTEAKAADDFNKLMGIPSGGGSMPPPAGGFTTPPPPPPSVKAPPPKVAPKTAPAAPTAPAMPPPMPNVPYQPTTSAPAKRTKEGKEEKAPKQRKYSETTVIPEGMVIPPPGPGRITKPPNLQQGKGRPKKNKDGTIERVGAESDEDFAQRLENAWVFKEVQARMLSPTAQAIFDTINGYQRMPAPEYKALGIAGASLVAVALSGLLFRKFYTTKGIPNARPVEDAAPGTMAISNRFDLARVYDDVNASLRRIGRRAGINKEVVNRLMQTFRIQTRNGGRALADSAVMEGRMDTPSFRFQVPVSLKKMAEASTPQTDEYLKALHLRDTLIAERNLKVGRAVESKQLTPSAPTRPVYEVRKETEAVVGRKLKDVEQQIKDIEAANPGVKNMAEANRAHNAEMIKFRESSGEYGTITKAEADALRMSHTNQLAGEGDGVIAAKANDARALIKERLDNEAIGKYVDETRKVDPRLFVKTTKEEIDAHPEWTTKNRNVVVQFKRQGEMEYYTTDPHIADVLKTDHHVITGFAGNTFYTTKRMLEATTTGNLAPNFAVTSAIRSYWIAKFTTEHGYRAPTAIGSVLAIPQQILPQLAKSISNGLERGSAGQLREMFETGAPGQLIGSRWIDGLSRRLAVVYEESVYAQLKAAGSHRGSVLEQQHRATAIDAVSKWYDAQAAKSNVAAGAQHFWNAWKASIEAVHSSVSFNYVKRNLGKEEMPYLAERARRLTGDPRAGGEMFVGGRHGGRQIAFESGKTGLNDWVANALVKTYGYTMDAAREAIPWWNPTLQGVKRLGEAWAHDPIRFARSAALYEMAPTAGLFYFAKYLDSPTPDGKLGGDPNGRSYVDYMLSGLSSYGKQMNYYIPLWGRPVEDGIQIPSFHEINPFRIAMLTGLHHALGGGVNQEDFARNQPFLPADHITHRRSLKEDMLIAAHSFLDTAAVPPMPPLINFALGSMGIRGPQGIFGGEVYTPKADPFNQNGGLSTSMEIMSRSLMGGIAESLGQFYANTVNSTGSLLSTDNPILHGLEGVRDVFVKKTPILRDITGILPDRSNNTDMTKEVFAHQKEFNELSRFYKKWTVKHGAIGTTPASPSGEIGVTEQLDLKRLNAGNPGLRQPQPDNPLYIQFMDKFYERFMKETPTMVKGEDKGGIAFKSMWRNYGRATQKIERLKDVNYGTYDRWQNDLNVTQEQIDTEQNPDVKAEMESNMLAKQELKENNVDTTNRRDVANFYRRMQYDALRVINYTRRAVEEEMSMEAGRPIKLKDIQPFLSTMQNLQESLGEAAPFMFRELLPGGSEAP
jgi:hypothetical protein